MFVWKYEEFPPVTDEMMIDRHSQGSSGLFQRQAAPANNLSQRGPLEAEDNLGCAGAD